MEKAFSLWVKDVNRKQVSGDSDALHQTATGPLQGLTLSYLLQERDGYTNSGIGLHFIISLHHEKKGETVE